MKIVRMEYNPVGMYVAFWALDEKGNEVRDLFIDDDSPAWKPPAKMDVRAWLSDKEDFPS